LLSGSESWRMPAEAKQGRPRPPSRIH